MSRSKKPKRPPLSEQEIGEAVATEWSPGSQPHAELVRLALAGDGDTLQRVRHWRRVIEKEKQEKQKQAESAAVEADRAARLAAYDPVPAIIAHITEERKARGAGLKEEAPQCLSHRSAPTTSIGCIRGVSRRRNHSPCTGETADSQ